MRNLLFLFFMCLAIVAEAQINVPINDQYLFKTPPALQEETTVTTPATGYGKIYCKTDNHLYFKNDLGAEYDLLAFLVGGTTFLGLLDAPDSYTGHGNELVFINAAEDSVIFSKGLTWNSETLDSALLITSDDINSGFAHISNDGSSYATFNYRNIGLTDGASATNIFPGSISTPNIRWYANETYFNWDAPDLLDFDEGPIEWHWHAEIGAPGSVLADPDGDGNIYPTLISDLYTETDPIWEADKLSYLTTASAASTYAALGGSYSDPAWINSLAWSKLTGTPTTLAGYGIADAVPSSRTISTTSPLTGGGDLSANRTISLPIPDGELVYGSGGTTVASSPSLKYDNALGNIALGGNGNAESYNMNLSEAAGRFEMSLTGYAASETKLFLRAAGGTQSSPTAVAAGDPLGVLGFIGWDGTSFASDASIGIKAVTSETWATGAHGGYLIFSVCATGTTAASKKMRLNTDGKLYVGGISAPSFGIECATDISGTALYANGTGGAGFLELNTQASAPSTPGTNDVRLFSNAGTLSWKRSDGFVRSFSSTVTADRTYTLQDASSTVAMYSNDLSVFSATSSAQFRGVLNDELGTGLALFDGATPSTGLTLTNCTGLPTAGLVNNAVTYAKLQTGGAHTMIVNNTSGAANFTETPFEFHNSQTYVGTYAMVAGTTAPSGTTNHSYTWQRVGNIVTLDIWIIFGTNGTAVTTASLTLPADCPSPAEPPGLTGGSDRLYAGTGWMESNSTASPGAARVMLRRNSGDTAYEILIVAGSNNGNYVHVNVTYYAQ